jgi:hypothetical protein
MSRFVVISEPWEGRRKGHWGASSRLVPTLRTQLRQNRRAIDQGILEPSRVQGSFQDVNLNVLPRGYE